MCRFWGGTRCWVVTWGVPPMLRRTQLANAASAVQSLPLMRDFLLATASTIADARPGGLPMRWTGGSPNSIDPVFPKKSERFGNQQLSRHKGHSESIWVCVRIGRPQKLVVSPWFPSNPQKAPSKGHQSLEMEARDGRPGSPCPERHGAFKTARRLCSCRSLSSG